MCLNDKTLLTIHMTSLAQQLILAKRPTNSQEFLKWRTYMLKPNWQKSHQHTTITVSKTLRNILKNCTHYAKETCRNFLVSFNKRYQKYICLSARTLWSKWTKMCWLTMSRRSKYQRRSCGSTWTYWRWRVVKVAISLTHRFSSRSTNCRRT